MKKWFLGGVLALAFFLRVVGISDYPTGFTPDEASFGYDAYSLLKTGKDQWGNLLPLTFKSFGDSKLPLYTYLTMPSVAVFGLNEFSTRLPSAILGTLAILATYLMVKELFVDWKYRGLNSNHLALFSSLLLAISPWHVPLSRGSFEANLTVFFMPMGVWAFLKGIKSDTRLLIASAFAFGLNMFSYHSARFVTPFIVIFLGLLFREELLVMVKDKLKKKHAMIALSVLFIFLAVSAFQFLSVGSSRASDVTIFNPTDKWMGVFERRVGAVFEGLSDPIARIFNNKYLYIADTFINNYIAYFSPQYLFTLGVSEWTYGMIAGRGVMYLFESVFIATFIWYLIKKGILKQTSIKFVILWLFIAVIPAALAKGPGYAGNRAAVMMPALQIISAAGGLILFAWLWGKINKKFGIIVICSFVLAFFISLVFFLEDYVYHAPRYGASGMLYGRKEAIEYVFDNENFYKEVIVSRTLSEPQIYVAFYGKVDPKIYQEASDDWLRFEEEGLPFLDQLGEYRLGKYIFKNINFIDDSKLPKTLLVGTPREFPYDLVVTEAIRLPDETPAVIIFDPERNPDAENI